MPVVDPKFKDAGKKRGLEIWRIKNFDLEVVPPEQFGNFYTGDSYIVLNTKGTEWDIHFWCGSETSIDERGTAAIKTVELDDSLGGLPVQYREIQDHESALFLSYFKSGIKYLKGGHASGFNHVVSEFKDYKPRLFMCKGKRNVRCTEVDCKLSSLNRGDVAILDLGLELLVFCPPDSGRLERIKGVNQAKSIRDQERAGRPKIQVLDEDWETNNQFWKVFGGKENAKKIKSAAEGGQDENYWLENRQKISLWKVSDASGKMTVTRVNSGALDTKFLNSDDSFIIDAVNGGVFVWIGKGCTLAERKKAQIYGTEYIKQLKRPAFTQVIRVLEGAEPERFTQFFTNWNAQLKNTSFRPKFFNVSNETGKLAIEQVENFTQEDLNPEDTTLVDAKNKIYIWIGSGEQTKPKVIHQGKETPGFKKLFPKWSNQVWAKVENDHKNIRNLLFRQNSGQQQSFLFAS
ncbi:Gelsolin-like protein 1 [Aphelenchoides besseyi]|nr:Gelsolin-like protein 1 [Aphelenchoides besseyi]